jgi:hypothetical protein
MNGSATRRHKLALKRAANAEDPDLCREVVRVALADLPATLQSTLEEEVARRADMCVVRVEAGPVLERIDLLVAVAQGADVLVLGTRDAASPPGICDHLLSEFPALMLLLVSHDGDLAMVHWQGPRRYRVGRVSAAAVLRISRRARAAKTSSGPVVQPDR